jgi:hypothetical protein
VGREPLSSQSTIGISAPGVRRVPSRPSHGRNVMMNDEANADQLGRQLSAAAEPKLMRASRAGRRARVRGQARLSLRSRELGHAKTKHGATKYCVTVRSIVSAAGAGERVRAQKWKSSRARRWRDAWSAGRLERPAAPATVARRAADAARSCARHQRDARPIRAPAERPAGHGDRLRPAR